MTTDSLRKLPRMQPRQQRASARHGRETRGLSMTASEALRHSRIALNHGSGAIPVVGFGTLIPDRVATKQATKTALEVGFDISIALNDMAMKKR
jgi:hypothetical protein